jgi:hypothetical protein
MGYKHRYDITAAYLQIRSAAAELNDPRNDGFIAWGVKQDLYQLKWFLDDLLKNSSTFSPEEEWLREQEQKKIIRILKDEM